MLKNIDNGKIGDRHKNSQIDYAKYYGNETAADNSKRTYSQIMDLDKYLKEINEGHKRKDRAKTAFQEPELALHENRPKALQLHDEKNYGREFRAPRNQDFDDKKPKLDRAKTKEPYLRGEKQEDDSADRIQRRKKELDKFLGEDDYSASRLSKISLKNRQINENYNKKVVEDSNKVAA